MRTVDDLVREIQQLLPLALEACMDGAEEDEQNGDDDGAIAVSGLIAGLQIMCFALNGDLSALNKLAKKEGTP